MSATVDASTRGRRNRANGATAERVVARWLRPWWPNACRAVRATSPDPGDIDLTHPSLFWSVKATKVEAVPTWMAELQAKRETRLGLLVVRRKGHASPGEWWCWLRLADLSCLCGGVDDPLLLGVSVSAPVRLELVTVMGLLAAAGFAPIFGRRPVGPDHLSAAARSGGPHAEDGSIASSLDQDGQEGPVRGVPAQQERQTALPGRSTPPGNCSPRQRGSHEVQPEIVRALPRSVHPGLGSPKAVQPLPGRGSALPNLRLSGIRPRPMGRIVGRRVRPGRRARQRDAGQDRRWPTVTRPETAPADTPILAGYPKDQHALRYDRQVWVLGEQDDQRGLLVAGHDRRSYAALNAELRQRQADHHAQWLANRAIFTDPTPAWMNPARHPLLDRPIRAVWVRFHTRCGCTPALHELHQASTDDGCDCAYPGLPPCAADDEVQHGFVYETVPDATAAAFPVLEVQR